MKYLVLIAVLFSGGMIAQPVNETSRSPVFSSVPSALSWYHRWQTHNRTLGVQSCNGLFSSGIYVIECKPLDVTIVVEVGVDGVCDIGFMRFSAGVPDLSASTGAHRPYRKPLNCGGLPEQEGAFAIQIEPVSGKVNLELSRRARDNAIQFLRGWPQRCLAQFPVLRDGDPFFHVYLTCNGALDTVLEFPINRGTPGTISHWQYTRIGKSLPEGHELRKPNRQLWLGSLWVGTAVIPKVHLRKGSDSNRWIDRLNKN